MSCKREHVCITANEVLITNKMPCIYSEQSEVGQVLMCGLKHQIQSRKLILRLTTTTGFVNLAMQLDSDQQLCKLKQQATCCFKQYLVASSLVMSKTSRKHQVHSSSTYYTAIDSHISRASRLISCRSHQCYKAAKIICQVS